MKMSLGILAGALTVSVCSTAAATQAAAASSVVHRPADVSASECIRGGGVIIINASGDGPYLTYCEGGTHDGETIS
ncbi:hypothetical protein ACYF6T_12140 [Streptomyces sp. 7R007]